MYICYISQLKNEETNQIIALCGVIWIETGLGGCLEKGVVVGSWSGVQARVGPSSCGVLPPDVHRARLPPQRGPP